MAKHFSEEEAKAWLAQQPSKVISAKVIFRDSAGKVLVLKPNFKPGWDFPGGVIEHNESPLAGALREAKEEIGLRLEKGRLAFLGVRYGYSERKNMDYIHFLFTATLTNQEIAATKVDPQENDDSRWIEAAEVRENVAGPFGPFAHRLLMTDSDNRFSDQDEIFA